jgi:membrane protease YdiL (CAAX protease family)
MVKRNFHPFLPTLGRTLLFCLASAVILATTAGATQSLPRPWASLINITAACIGSLLLTLLFSRWDSLPLKNIGIIPGRHTAPRFLTGFLIGLILAALQLLSILITGHAKLVWSADITLAPVIQTFLLYILAAGREEIAFRGYPLRSLNRVIGPWSAQLIVAFIFALEHVVSGQPFLQALTGNGLGSLLFGWAALATGGLAMSIGLHAAWNFGQWTLGLKNEPGLWRLVIDESHKTQAEQVAWVGYVLAMGLAIAGFYFYWRKKTSLP